MNPPATAAAAAIAAAAATADGELRMPVVAMIRHAGSVADVAEAMETNREAAARVLLGAQAYGQLCGFC